MPFVLSEINRRTKTDPRGFAEECEAAFARRVAGAADRIQENLRESPVVLLAGPSGSGKTTTAKKLRDELRRRGVGAHAVSLDDYSRPLPPARTPRTPAGEPDYESPLYLDMDLLAAHFAALDRGAPIAVPRYDFIRQQRATEEEILRPGPGEAVIFEGIHALCDGIAACAPGAFRLFISVGDDVTDGGAVVFSRHWMRLLRRAVRDARCRGADGARTLGVWPTVRRGEALYIDPCAHRAALMLSSAFPCEVPALRRAAEALFAGLPPRGELERLLPALARFEPMDEKLLPPDSLLREFLGGGCYEQ